MASRSPEGPARHRVASFLLDVVAPERVVLAEIESPREDDGMSPAGPPWVGDLEAADLSVLLRIRVHEGHVAVLVQEIEVAVGVGDRRRAGTLRPLPLAPDHLAGLDVGAERRAAVITVTVNLVADDDDPAVLVLERAVEILLLHLDLAVLDTERQQSPALVVPGAAEDLIAEDDGSRDVRGGPGELVVLPQELAVPGRDADDAGRD